MKLSQNAKAYNDKKVFFPFLVLNLLDLVQRFYCLEMSDEVFYNLI